MVGATPLTSGPPGRHAATDSVAMSVLAVSNQPPLAQHQRQATEEMIQMVRELLADPQVPWPSDLPGPQWR